MESLRERAKKGEVLFGWGCLTSSSEFVEIAGLAGFDFLYLDREHHIYAGWESLKQIIQAADAVKIPCIIRLEAIDSKLITTALNIGAQGIMVPHLCTKEEAIRLVNACRFPPEGRRTMEKTTRTGRFGLDIEDWVSWMRQKNEEILVGGMMEDKESIANLEDILSVKGLDFVCFGPWDYSISVGLIGQTQHPNVLESFNKVIAKSKQYGVSIWKSIDPDFKAAEQLVKKGVQIILLGEDLEVYANICRDVVNNIVKKLKKDSY